MQHGLAGAIYIVRAKHVSSSSAIYFFGIASFRGSAFMSLWTWKYGENIIGLYKM